MKNWIYSPVTIIELMLNLSYYWCFLILFHYQYKDITATRYKTLTIFSLSKQTFEKSDICEECFNILDNYQPSLMTA